MRSVRSAFPEQAPYMEAAGAGHPEPRIPAPGCRLSMVKSRRLLRESGEEAAICIVVTICTAPARLGAVVLTSAWLEDGPHGARDHSVWQWLSLRWRLHCSEARPWRSLSGLVPKVRPKAATSASTAGRRRCRVRGPTPTRRAGTPCGRVGVITKPTKAQASSARKSAAQASLVMDMRLGWRIDPHLFEFHSLLE